MKTALFAFLTLVGTACIEEKDYCSEYVDYMCSCHEDDPDYDCDAQQAIYEEADLEQQIECSVTLDEQLVQDEEDGVDCEVTPEDTGV